MDRDTVRTTVGIGSGAVLGGFRLLEVLGEGGMGVVFRAENLHAPSLIRAIKVIRPEFAARPDFRQRFLREADLMERLRHPNILRVENVVEEMGILFLVMEYLVGRTAEQLLAAKRGLLPIGEAHGIVVAALNGIAHAHQRRIIHRDLKPANIFLCSDGTVKVLDLGIAKDIGARVQLTNTGQGTPGTPAYYAPEFLDGAPASPASDVYAMGITLFELLAGRPPFLAGGGTERQAALSLMVQNATQPIPDVRTFRSEVPEQLARVVQRATAKKISGRYSDAKAFLAELEPALSMPPDHRTGDALELRRDIASADAGPQHRAPIGARLDPVHQGPRRGPSPAQSASSGQSGRVEGESVSPRRVSFDWRRSWQLPAGAITLGAALAIGIVWGQATGPKPKVDPRAPAEDPLGKLPIKIDSFPDGAEIYEVGTNKRLGRTPQFVTFDFKKSDTFSIVLKKNGYEDAIKEVRPQIPVIARLQPTVILERSRPEPTRGKIPPRLPRTGAE